MNQDDQIQYLGLDKLNVLDKINNALSGQFQITGSISLLEYGIIKRKVNDIDITVRSLDFIKKIFDKKDYEFQEWFDYSEKLEDPKKTDQEKGKVTNRVSFKINGVKVCAFFFEKGKSMNKKYMVGREFKVLHPKYSIKAKKRFIQRMLEKDDLTDYQIYQFRKHMEDILSYGKYQNTKKEQLPF